MKQSTLKELNVNIDHNVDWCINRAMGLEANLASNPQLKRSDCNPELDELYREIGFWVVHNLTYNV